MFTAEEAYKQAKLDVEAADRAVNWFAQQFGGISADQAYRVRVLVLEMRYDDHIHKGRLAPRS